ncbi:MAG: tripartite tricarboxylate transporter substrate binding protein [Xanthobacteraceae bacterium]|nr:tripartite tricarboxylate transporter substrate binding protein [Xanthobacteraceae bacterium]
MLARPLLCGLRSISRAAALGLCVLCLLGDGITTAHAAYPDHLIRIVVPFPPGGGTDIVTRRLGEAMAADLGQPVIIENKPGAGTIIGTGAVATGPPDGYTLLMATFSHAVNPALNSKLPYDTFRAFAPVALVARSFNIVVVNPGLPIHNIKDLIAAAKAKPGTINFGSYGVGTSAHLAGELFKSMAGVDIVHVPYKGAAPAITDLMGGQIQVMFTTVASVAAYIPTGQLRALAVTSAARSPVFPDLMTVAESGVPGYVAESWYGLYAPAGTPADIIERLNGSVAHAVQSGVLKSLEEVEGLTLTPGPPAELDKYVRGEAARWQDLISKSNLKLE